MNDFDLTEFYGDPIEVLNNKLNQSWSIQCRVE